MRLPPALLCIFLLAAGGCSKGCTPGPARPSPTLGYSYLVTPSGRMYRLLKIGPAVTAENATMLFYAGDTPEVARIESDAEALVAALGPEREAAGDRNLIVRVNVGFDARRDFSPAASYDVAFRLTGGQWLKIPSGPAAASNFSVDGSPTPPEDVVFPFDPKTMEAAAAAAANWLALLDAGAEEAALSGMTDSFRGQVEKAKDQWRGVVQRRGGLSQSRVELYRQQSRATNLSAPNGITALEYLARTPSGARLLERVTVVCDASGCKVAGYTFQPIRGG